MHLFSKPPPPESPLSYGDRMRLLVANHYRGIVPSIICIILALLMVRPSAEKPILLLYVYLILLCVFLIWPMHIGISAMITVFTLPPLGILSSAATAQCYLTDSTMLWICVMAVAIAWQQSRNPYRCVLCIIQFFGTSHASMLFGLCLATAFISILLPNYMAALMMMPILSKLMQIFERQINYEPPYKTVTKDGVTTTTPSSYVIAYYLGVAYSANVGSLCFLISSTASLALKAQYHMVYVNSPDIFSIVGFLYYSFSCMLILFFALYLYLFFFCIRKPWVSQHNNAAPDQVMDEFTHAIEMERQAMGSMPLRECIMVVMLIILLILCIGSNLPWSWRTFAEDNYVAPEMLAKHASYVGESALFAAAFVFIHATPFKRDLFKYCLAFHRAELPPKKEMESLVDWKKAAKPNTPWSIWLLIGTGVAIMRSYTAINAADYFGPSVAGFDSFDILLTTFIIGLIIALLCNAVVNVGACHLVMPLAVTVALQVKLHPAVLPYTLMAASNFVYMLPVAWSSIKVVKENGNIPLKTLICYGIGATIISLLVLMANIYINMLLFGWDTAPAEKWTVAGAEGVAPGDASNNPDPVVAPEAPPEDPAPEGGR